MQALLWVIVDRVIQKPDGAGSDVPQTHPGCAVAIHRRTRHVHRCIALAQVDDDTILLVLAEVAVTDGEMTFEETRQLYTGCC